MKLDKRLRRISELVSKDATLVDIGCDHGWLGIYLLEKKLVKHVYAADVAQGPLDNVRGNIKKYHLEKQMDAILSDGLASFQDIAFSDVAIAGMGGSLIIDIIDENLELLDDKYLILQANINVAGLRRYLLEHDFIIIEEDVIAENNISYNIIKTQKSKNIKNDDYQPIEIEYGRDNLLSHNPLTKQMIKDDYAKYQTLMKKVAHDPDRQAYFANKMMMIKEYLDGIKEDN